MPRPPGGVGVAVNVGGNGNQVNVGVSIKKADFDSLSSLENKTPEPVADSNDAHPLLFEYEVESSNSTLSVDEFNVTDDYQNEYTDELHEFDYRNETHGCDYEYDNNGTNKFEPYWDVNDSGSGNEINVVIEEKAVP